MKISKYNSENKKGLLLLFLFIIFLILLFCLINNDKTNNSVSNEQTGNGEDQSNSSFYEITEEVDESGIVTNENIEMQESNEEFLTVYNLNYNELGNYGRKQEYEGDDEIFYYFPNGIYLVERKNGSDSYCYLWLLDKNGYQTEWGTAYNSAGKYTYSYNGQSKSITITENVTLWNSNNCSYELTKIQ